MKNNDYAYCVAKNVVTLIRVKFCEIQTLKHLASEKLTHALCTEFDKAETCKICDLGICSVRFDFLKISITNRIACLNLNWIETSNTNQNQNQRLWLENWFEVETRTWEIVFKSCRRATVSKQKWYFQSVHQPHFLLKLLQPIFQISR